MNNDYESLPTNSVAVHMTAGAVAGIMEHCVMYPFDSVKTRMQALTPGPGGGGGVGEVLTRMIRQEGVLRPIRGVGAVVAGAGPAHALYFSCYECLKEKFKSTRSQFNHLVYGAAGCVATVLHDGVMNPAEVVKQRLQMYNSPYRDVMSCIQHVYQKEGIFAFYRSYTTQLAMNVPFQSIHFISYEFMQSITNPEHTYNPLAHIGSGAAAGAIAAAATTPLDVCKTVLNTQQDGVHAQGMIDAFKQVYRFGGIQGYFRGLRARVLFQAPATAICWVIYESFKYALRGKQDDEYSDSEADNEITTGINQNPTLVSRSNSFQGAVYKLQERMAKKAGDVCGTRCQLFRNERIRKENAIRIKWFLENQQRLIEHLREPKFTKRAREIIAEAKKRETVRVDTPVVQRKPLPLWRPPRSDGSINIGVMKSIDPDVRAILYEKGIPTFIAANNYLTERYKELPEKRFCFPDCTNWIYGWRLDDYPAVPLSEVGLKSVMLAQFYQRKSFNLERDPEWYRGCQMKNARNFNETMTY